MQTFIHYRIPGGGWYKNQLFITGNQLDEVTVTKTLKPTKE